MRLRRKGSDRGRVIGKPGIAAWRGWPRGSAGCAVRAGMCSAMLPARERCWLQVFAVEARYEEGPFALPASREEFLALLESELERCERAVSRCFRRTGFPAHWHLIPRRTGDDKSPRGGVRGGYQAQTALLSGGLTFGRADEGDWGGTATPEARLAAATARPSQKESQQGLLPGAGRPKPRSSTRSGAIEKPAAHVLVKDTADQGLVGNALLQGTGTQGA